MFKYIKVIRYYYYYLKNILLFKIKKIDCKSILYINGTLYIKNKGKCTIGNNFKCNSGKNYNAIGGDTVCRIIIQNDATVSIGDNVGISNSTIVASKHISIADNVLIGGSCKIWDTDFHALDPYIRIIEHDKIINSKPIKICKNVFIGSNCIILKGVEIGENSIIAAGSIVSKNIPKNEIWGGNPIKFINKVTISHEF